MTARLAAALAIASLALAAPAAAQRAKPAALEGKVSLELPRGARPSAVATVVWLPGVEAGAPAGLPTIISKNKRFEPRVLAVPTGTRVRFPNVDTIYHNAFSLSPGNAFDLGLYRRGAYRDVTLDRPGVVRVYCNIHPEMAAYVVVMEGGAHAVAGIDGAFRIDGIPPGRHVVKLWSEFGGDTETTLDFPAGGTLSWDPTIDASRFRARPHTNKHGRRYPRATSDVDRY